MKNENSSHSNSSRNSDNIRQTIDTEKSYDNFNIFTWNIECFFVEICTGCLWAFKTQYNCITSKKNTHKMLFNDARVGCCCFSCCCFFSCSCDQCHKRMIRVKKSHFLYANRPNLFYLNDHFATNVQNFLLWRQKKRREWMTEIRKKKSYMNIFVISPITSEFDAYFTSIKWANSWKTFPVLPK